MISFLWHKLALLASLGIVCLFFISCVFSPQYLQQKRSATIGLENAESYMSMPDGFHLLFKYREIFTSKDGQCVYVREYLVYGTDVHYKETLKVIDNLFQEVGWKAISTPTSELSPVYQDGSHMEINVSQGTGPLTEQQMIKQGLDFDQIKKKHITIFTVMLTYMEPSLSMCH